MVDLGAWFSEERRIGGDTEPDPGAADEPVPDSTRRS